MSSDDEEEFGIEGDEFYNMLERKDLSKFNDLGGAAGIAEAVQSDLEHGIESTDAESLTRRLDTYGPNRLPEAEKVTFLGLVWEALQDRMMQMLIVAAVVSIVFGMTLEDETGEVDREKGWIEGVAILISVTVVVLVTSINDYQKAKKFEELSKAQGHREVQVIRDGEVNSIDESDLLVGDLMAVEAGQNLPADGVYVDGQDLKCDEAAATGESDIKKKNSTHDPFFISGTNVTEGSGHMMVIGVGVSSFSGRLTVATRAPADPTPLQKKLAVLADMIGKLGLAAALVTLLVLTVKEVIQIVQNGKEAKPANFLEFIIIAITIVVVAIPEGLPLAVTIALAFSMKSMLADNCLVRVLASCETMGGVSAICSDKTGTLTKNQMTVVQGWVADEEFVIPGSGVNGRKDATNPLKEGMAMLQLKTKIDLINLFCEAVCLNATAEQKKDEAGKFTWMGGNKTEHGILDFVGRLGRDLEVVRGRFPPKQRRTYPFSSAKKRMTTLCNTTGQLYVKGASEMVLADCEWYLNADGETEELTHVKRAELESVIIDMANQGNRTIAVAMAKMPPADTFPEEEPNPKLTCIALLGIQDPIRPEVPEAVATCQRAGIVVRMVTGDNINTAIAIAKKCGIYKEGVGVALEGVDFRQMAEQDPGHLATLLPRLQVLARSSPTDKHVLVKSLVDHHGEIVAVTGDGTNDAPALKLADVGFAMRSGTEVAKGASDMVLMDDNFATVVNATRWGRTVNDNVRKFIQFQLTVNVVGVLLTFIGAALSEDNQSPLTAVQLLWLNLIMDTMAALALSTEKPSEECLNRQPVYRTAPIISRRMWAFITGHGCFQLTTSLLLLNLAHKWFAVGPCRTGGSDIHGSLDDGHCKGGLEHSTITFNVFILMQVFNEFNARKLYGEINPFSGLHRSKLLIGIFFVTLGFQVFAVEVAREFMGTVGLSWSQWLGCIGIASLELPVGVILNLVPIREYHPPRDNNTAFTAQRKPDDLVNVRTAGSAPVLPHSSSSAAILRQMTAGSMQTHDSKQWQVGNRRLHSSLRTISVPTMTPTSSVASSVADRVFVNVGPDP